MRTLIQLTTTATLAACLQLNTVGTANATRLASNSTTNLRKDRSTSTVLTVAPTYRFAHYPKYEPDPNGNPKSDGTGTRWQNLTALARAVPDRGRDRRLWWKSPSSILVFNQYIFLHFPPKRYQQYHRNSYESKELEFSSLCRYSLWSWNEVNPFRRNTIGSGAKLGGASTSKCTWSGIISIATIEQRANYTCLSVVVLGVQIPHLPIPSCVWQESKQSGI